MSARSLSTFPHSDVLGFGRYLESLKPANRASNPEATFFWFGVTVATTAQCIKRGGENLFEKSNFIQRLKNEKKKLLFSQVANPVSGFFGLHSLLKYLDKLSPRFKTFFLLAVFSLCLRLRVGNRDFIRASNKEEVRFLKSFDQAFSAQSRFSWRTSVHFLKNLH